MRRSLFIFHRDLRLEDNTALIEALECSGNVIPCFIFTPEQIENNPYRSDRCLQFMLESLEDLEEQLAKKGGKLYLFYGKPEEVVEQCIAKLQVEAVFSNRDYTPYSIARDEKIRSTCKKRGVPFSLFEDALLHAPEKPYKIFTPYLRYVEKLPIREPRENPFKNYFTGSISFSLTSSLYEKILPKRVPQLHGGRSHLTTPLSPYLKFTVISPREVYTSHPELLRSLCWRDFFTSIAFFFPHVFQGAFHKKFDNFPWSYDKEAFQKWCEGQTGFPIIDAAMRELLATGFINNQLRMVVACFLVKDLGIDWRWGERYFARTLIDYDPAVNNGNWQWVASTGASAQPTFRVFNPWIQQKKVPPEYLQKWIPELNTHTYPKPMVDHEEAKRLSLSKYASLLSISRSKPRSTG